jgi:DNA-binding NtrC family response regulator
MTIQHELVGDSPAIAELLREIEKAARCDAPVLIQGESGTGKELVAQAVHRNGRRCGRRMVALNCVGLDKNLLASELFGHEKGAFTGADRRRIGKFELADGGTLFLDEMGDMAVPLQPELLRVLEQGEIERVGGSITIPVNVRIIAATNRDLEAAVEEGEFRSELYYRLNVVPIRTPPLREHKEDIPALIQHFLCKYGHEREPPATGVSEEAMAMISMYDWPGNVRQLRNAIRHAIVMGSGDTIVLQDLRGRFQKHETEPSTLTDGVRNFKRRTMLNALNRAEGHITKAAILLGIDPRSLRRLIRKLNRNEH